MGLLDIKDDPNYVNANEATKRAIFDEYSKDDSDYQNANPATKDAIRKEFGLSATTGTPAMLTTEPSLGTVAEQQATGIATQKLVGSPVTRVVPGTPGVMGPIKPTLTQPGVIPTVADEAVQLGKIAGQITPEAVGQFLSSPLKYTGQGIQAFAQRYAGPHYTTTIAEGLKNIPKALPGVAQGIGSALVAPENLIALPYQMAGYEQEKIRANPTAPEYQTNPYAQAYRGEYATQGAAGAANRRNAIASQQYGGLTQEEQDILEQDRIEREVRRKAAQKALGPIAP